jgi:hypothetical protein
MNGWFRRWFGKPVDPCTSDDPDHPWDAIESQREGYSARLAAEQELDKVRTQWPKVDRLSSGLTNALTINGFGAMLETSMQRRHP